MDCQNVKKSTSADRVAVFQDTQNWCETDPDLIAYIQKAKKAIEIFYEDNYPAFNAANTRNQTITVTGERSHGNFQNDSGENICHFRSSEMILQK